MKTVCVNSNKSRLPIKIWRNSNEMKRSTKQTMANGSIIVAGKRGTFENRNTYSNEWIRMIKRMRENGLTSVFAQLPGV